MFILNYNIHISLQLGALWGFIIFVSENGVVAIIINNISLVKIHLRADGCIYNFRGTLIEFSLVIPVKDLLNCLRFLNDWVETSCWSGLDARVQEMSKKLKE